MELRNGIKTDGFDEEPDIGILKMICGDERRVRVRQTVLDSYDLWVATSQAFEEYRYASPADCKRNFAAEIDVEILRFEEFQEHKLRSKGLEPNRIACVSTFPKRTPSSA